MQFVGDETCATCHEDLYASYATHGMARSFYRLTPEAAVEDFSGVEIRHEPTGFVYTARREGDRFVQEERREAPDGTVSHRLVRTMDYVVGSGSAARTYLSEENGRLYELPLTWYTQPLAGADSAARDGPLGAQPRVRPVQRTLQSDCPRAVHGLPQRDERGGPVHGWQVRLLSRRDRL